MKQIQINVSTPAGSGNVATDLIQDNKGDLAVGVQSNSAQKLGIGIDGQILTADSSTTTGLRWANSKTMSTDPIQDNKGDIVIGIGDETATKLPMGSDGQILIIDSSTTTGLRQADADLTGSPGGSYLASDITYDGTDSVEYILDNVLNRGILEAIDVTDDGGLNIAQNAGTIFDYATKSVIKINSGSGSCANNNTNYLKQLGGNSLTISTTIASGNNLNIATISCQANDIFGIISNDVVGEKEANISRALRSMFPSIVSDGLIISEDPDSTNIQDVSISGGTYIIHGHERCDVTSFNSRNKNIIRWFHSGGVWTSDTSHSIDITKYDNGTDLVAVTPAKYHRSLFLIVGDTIHWIYPSAEYGTVLQAKNAGNPPIPPGISIYPRLASVIIQGNDTIFPLPGDDQQIDVRPTIYYIASGMISDHGNLSGLSDNDHPQYALATQAQDFLTIQVFS